MPRLNICSCGRLFEPKPWQVKYGRDKVCPACTPPDPHHSQEYRKARKKRMTLAGSRCEQCGSTRKLQCDHVNGNPNDHRVANLRILCLKCHQDKTRLQLAQQGRHFEPKLGLIVSGPKRSKYRRKSRTKPKSTKSMRLV